MSFRQKKIDGKLFNAMQTFPSKTEAKKIAEKLRKEEYHGYNQLARVIKTRMGWTVYVTVGRNIRYGIPRKAYTPQKESTIKSGEVIIPKQWVLKSRSCPIQGLLCITPPDPMKKPNGKFEHVYYCSGTVHGKPISLPEMFNGSPIYPRLGSQPSPDYRYMTETEVKSFLNQGAKIIPDRVIKNPPTIDTAEAWAEWFKKVN